jgi:septal ring-binding cell division protein DamX
VITPPRAPVPAPAPAPVQITAQAPPPAPAATSTQPLPRVTARVPSGREAIDARARDYAANPSGNYTVQIQILCDPGNVEKAVRTGGDRVWYVPQTLGTRSCYRLFWGRFDTREEAQRALADVPPGLRDRSAAVKAVPR